VTPAAVHDDVALVRWPHDAPTRGRRRARGLATLLVLAPGQPPPETWSPLEDWVREPLDAVELYTRREHLRRRLAARPAAVLDDDGLLHRGPHWVALSPAEGRLVAALLANLGSAVARAALVDAVRPHVGHDPHRTLDTFVRRARDRLRPLGLVIHTVRGTGFLLEARDLPPAG